MRCVLILYVLMQLFVGRVAMLGFAAELIGEELTGTATAIALQFMAI